MYNNCSTYSVQSYWHDQLVMVADRWINVIINSNSSRLLCLSNGIRCVPLRSLSHQRDTCFQIDTIYSFSSWFVFVKLNLQQSFDCTIRSIVEQNEGMS